MDVLGVASYRVLIRSLKKNGLVGTWSKGIRHIAARLRVRAYQRALARGLDAKGIFTQIYNKHIWNSSEYDTAGASISGANSSIVYTSSLREQLSELLRKLGVKVLFDAPCGDFNWMRLVESPEEMTYIGADIVDELVAANNARYAGPRHSFRVFDLSRDAFPQADLWFCRNCLFHLSYRDIYGALSGFARSRIPYVMTTTHVNDIACDARVFANNDIVTGAWRLIDLCSAPFNFPARAEHEIWDFVPPDPPRKMCLWTREQIAACLPGMAEFLDRRVATATLAHALHTLERARR